VVFGFTDHDNLTSGNLGLVMKSLQGKVSSVCVCARTY